MSTPSVKSSFKFGSSVLEQADALAQSGKDPNQSANILCQKDPEGRNYGIGIVLDGQGKPMATSSTLLDYLRKEIDQSSDGSYKNSASQIESLTEAVLKWQQIPEKYWKNFKLILPSDAGTGAVQTALELSLMLNPSSSTIGIEKLGWPAYKTIANVSRVGVQEFDIGSVMEGKNLVSVYQAGPMNTTGQVTPAKNIQDRASSAKKNKQPVILDRAYSGFEYARDLKKEGYARVMKKSYQHQLAPFVEQGVPFFLSISPTKAFVTFALRPCGFLLVHWPEAPSDLGNALNTVIRARGSSFEHPVSRAFVKAMVNDRSNLEMEHETALARVAESEVQWKTLTKGTRMEAFFSENYAGLFRNTQIDPDGSAAIYDQHLYPVFSKGRCRINVTGIPSDETLAKKHVSTFSKYCF